MNLKFWKLSQGIEYFSSTEISDSIKNKLVYVHESTGSKGGSSKTQGQQFVEASVGDYFYMTHGNSKIYLLGQFTGLANIFSSKGDGWVDRPFRVIKLAKENHGYKGSQKWWTPNYPSTFISIPEKEFCEFETKILKPFFDIEFKNYGLNII